MARVYLARMTGTAGFSRLVAIKRMHPELAAEHDVVAMLADEARLTSQIRHSNVVDTIDLVASEGGLSLVLEYVEGEALSFLIRRAQELKESIPRPIALAIIYGVLRGLDAAHEARNEDGEPLGVVHRDVSPQNVLVGIDGVPRIIDFGVAKALGRSSFTKPGEVRGKFAYMAPEQLLGRPVTRQVDIYAAGALLWELLVGRRLFSGDDPRTVCAAIIRGDVQPPSAADPTIPAAFDAIIARATAQDLGERYLTARELLADLEGHERASDDVVGAWVRRLAAERLAERHRMLRASDGAASASSLDEVMATFEGSADSVRSGRRFDVLSGERSLLGKIWADPAEDTVTSTGMIHSASASGVTVVTPGGPKSASRRNKVFVLGLGVVGGVLLAGALVSARRIPPKAPIIEVSAGEAPPADSDAPAEVNATTSAFVEPEPTPSTSLAPASTPALVPKSKQVRKRSPPHTSTDPKSYR
jgi:serine/threonine-protein kinase